MDTCPEFFKTVASILVGFCAGLGTHFFTIRRESEKRRHAFRERLRQLHFRLVSIPGNKWVETYRGSVDEIRNASASVYEDIKKENRVAFDNAWRKYCCEQDDKETELDYDTSLETYATGVGYMNPSFSKAQEVIHARLMSLLNAAK